MGFLTALPLSCDAILTGDFYLALQQNLSNKLSSRFRERIFYNLGEKLTSFVGDKQIVRSFSKNLHYSQDSRLSFCSSSKSNGKEKVKFQLIARQTEASIFNFRFIKYCCYQSIFFKYPDRMIASLIKKIGKSLERAIGSFCSHIVSFYRKRTKSPKVRI